MLKKILLPFITILLGIFVLAPLMSLVLAFVFMLLWNWLAPIFWVGAPILGYWECVGVMIFINLLKITCNVNTANKK